MASVNVHQEIIEKLHSVYQIKGYITVDSVLNAIIEHELPLDEVEYVCDHLLSRGVIIRDNSVKDSADDDNVYDRSQIDYEKLFQEIIAIDEHLVQFIQEIRQITPPQYRECQNLMLQAKEGNLFAKQRIVEMYLRTVVRIALWHHEKYKIPLAEAIQDGCVGLVIALDKYEIGRQDKFSTYAPWWIRQKIIRKASVCNPLVSIPVYVKDKLFSIYEICEQHYCNQCDSNKICLEIIKAVSEELGCSQSKAEVYIKYLDIFESIEELIEKDQSIFFDDGIAEEQMFINYNQKELKNAISQILQTLTPREEEVILLRFGFVDGKEWTLEEVGNEFSVTRERIRQIQKKAFSKLRHPSRSKKLRWFLD